MDDILIFITAIFVIGTVGYLVLPILPVIAIVYMIVGSVMNLLEL